MLLPLIISVISHIQGSVAGGASRYRDTPQHPTGDGYAVKQRKEEPEQHYREVTVKAMLLAACRFATTVVSSAITT